MNLIPPPSTLPPGSTVWTYLRDSGGENQDRSISRQLEVIQSYCDQHRLQLVHVYKDEAKSGTTTAGRDDFMRMVAQSDKGDGNPTGLLLWSFSRFGRNLDDAQYYKSRLRRNNIIIHSLTDQIPEGPYSRFVETLVDISNEERSRATSIDAKDGLRSLVMQKAVPGVPPRGFKREPIKTRNPRTGEERIRHKWIPDPKLLPRVRQAWQMKASGAPLSEIHKKTRLFASANSWHTFFTNKLYIGILEFGDLVIEDYCEPVIDMDTWNAVQKRLEIHSQARFKEEHPKRATSAYLLSGLLVCARCGAPMNGNTTIRNNTENRDEGYRCSRSKRHAGCDAGRVNRRKLEDLVLSTLDEFILQPENIEAVQEIAIENQTDGERKRQARREDLHDEKRAVSRAIANTTAAIRDVGHSDALIKSLREDEGRLAEIKKELDQLEIPIEPVPNLTQPQIVAASTKLRKRLNDAPLEEKRLHLKEIIFEVRAERVENHIFALITYWYPIPEPSPPFDIAPMDDTMLPMSRLPMGAPRYRQLFTYPAVAEIKTRSK